MISRKGSNFVNGITLIGIIASMFLSMEIIYQFIIPFLLVCHIKRISDLTVKDRLLRTDCFTLSSYKPIQRLFLSRIVAGFLICFFSLIPIMTILLFEINLMAILILFNGIIVLNLVAAILGMITQSKKLFEVIFIFLTYANINKVSIFDYYGATNQSPRYLVMMLSISLMLTILLILFKKIEHLANHKLIYR
jgi:hypothetical protein